MALARAIEHLRRKAGVAQAPGVHGGLPAEPERPLIAQQRLAGPLGPALPGRPCGDRLGDLLRRRVQVAETARGAGGLAAARDRALEHDDIRPPARERVRGGEPDDPRPDDRDVRTARYAAAPRARRAG